MNILHSLRLWSESHPVISALLFATIVLAGLYLLKRFLADRADSKRSMNLVFLRIKVPKKEGREEKDQEGEQFGSGADYAKQISLMTQCLETISAYASSKYWQRYVVGQNFHSYEIVATEGQIYFYLVVPVSEVGAFQKTVTSFYSDAVIEEVEEYNLFKPGTKAHGLYVNTTKDFAFPIKTYNYTNSEPMNAILNAMSKLSQKESAALQIVVRPAPGGWQDKSKQLASDIYEEKKGGILSWFSPLTWLRMIARIFAVGTDDNLNDNSPEGSGRTSPHLDELAKAIGEKASHDGWETTIRIVATAPEKHAAEEIANIISTTFGQYSSNYGNGFTVPSYYSKRLLIKEFLHRNLSRQRIVNWLHKKMLFGSDELASIWHVPSAKYNNVPSVAWQRFRVVPPPDNLPEEGDITLGYTMFRGKRQDVKMQLDDRFRHLYLIGQTGTGKSVFLDSMIKQDIRNGKGVCVVDPHGDLVEDALGWVPRERADDVIVFDPADTERPIGVNMLEAETPEERDFVALEAMNMMIGMFGNEIFGPRIQDYFRNGCLTLMEDPNGGALTDIVRLFTDDAWQQEKIKHIKNPIVKGFWVNQMANTGQREKQEMIPYFAAKFGCFITNTLMRNIIGQTKSAFKFDEVMDDGKILLVKLAKGLVGDINANLLGMIFVNKMQVAAMRRQQIADKSQRTPFFLYVDEFQNFITDSFESILSEARKYKLGLVVAHQYIDQLIKDGKDEKIKNAIFGNVGTMMNLKIGAKDAEYMAKEMGPSFTETDLINLEGFNACLKLNLNNQITRPFSMKTIKWWEETPDDTRNTEVAEALVQLSRLKYGRDKEFVSREIIRRIGASTSPDTGPDSNPLGL